MSAHMVDNTHIDYLLSSGLSSRASDVVRWYDVDPAQNLPDDAYQRGNWIGRGSIRWHQEHARELRLDTADRVGAVLLAENRRSVDHRYDEEDLEEFYSFRRVRPDTITPIRVLDACRGYVYQSCEHPGWHTSEARQVIEAIKNRMIARLCGDADGWHITDVEYDNSIGLMEYMRNKRESN